jgi:glycosyltransferase involved in cell wall biosynthesis
MIIGIDGNEANVENKVGIGEYAYELLVQFHKIYSKRSDLKFRVYLKNPPRLEMPVPSVSWQYKVVKPGKLWTRIGLPLKLFTENSKPDVFFTPTHYGPRFSPVPTVISIMDLSYIHFPELFRKNDLYQLLNWTKFSAKKAKKIFTISEFSKNDIIKAYKKASADVVVTYPGIKPIGSSKVHKILNMQDLSKKFGINKNYILFVGTLQPRKNIEKLVEAFSKLQEKDLQLIIVGKKGWLYENILTSPDKFGVSDKVKFLDFVEDEDLPSIYKNALCFVLPSLYEGFGLPVLEAMKYGCPVLVSNVSSLPEAGGEAALYFDPNNVNDMSKAIEKVISNEKLRQDMIKKGYNQIKKFSWEKTAKETLKVLESIANE